ncbi:MAG: proton-conducting transporter membrane subunit [Pseudomonadota bacterium]
MSGFGLIALVPLLPLVAAGLIALLHLAGVIRGEAGEPWTARLALWPVALSLLILLGLDLAALAGGTPGSVTLGYWLVSGNFEVAASFLLDALALGLGTLVGLIAFLTLRFSVNYMQGEPAFHRFFIALCLFAGGMQLIVFAGNAAFTFVGWELTGISAYLLIGYAYDRTTASGNALRVLLTQYIGDAGFVLGIALAFAWLGSLEWPAIAAGSQQLTSLAAALLGFGFVLAALARSAQLPFAPWLARALEGPTPSSAICCGALMVHAGIYLLIRLEPVLAQAPALMGLLVLLGALTALYGALAGLTQTDVKSALIFASTTQLGLMVLACGLGWFEWAAWHLALHAAFRAWQFLAAPSYLHLIGGPIKPVPEWLAQRQGLYTAALNRFWLEPMTDGLLLRPTRALAQDMRVIDAQVVSRLAGLSEPARQGKQEVVRDHGAAGRLLAWVADRLEHFERRLVLQTGGGRLAWLLDQLGRWLVAVEGLLERPRYLLVLIMATLIVIL